MIEINENDVVREQVTTKYSPDTGETTTVKRMLIVLEDAGKNINGKKILKRKQKA